MTGSARLFRIAIVRSPLAVVTVAGVAMLLGGARLAPVAAQVAGSEFQVNTFTTSYQGHPAAASDPAGGFIVVWDSDGQDGSGRGTFGRRFDASGVPTGAEFPVNSYTPLAQGIPAVAADGSGNFVVTWQSFDGDSYGIWGRFLAADGMPASDEFQVNSFTANDQSRPAIAPAGAGEFLVVWESAFQDGSSLGVYGQRARRGLFLDSFESSDLCAWSSSLGGGVCP